MRRHIIRFFNTRNTACLALLGALALPATPSHAARGETNRRKAVTGKTRSAKTEIAQVQPKTKFARPITTVALPALSLGHLDLAAEDFDEQTIYEGSREPKYFPASKPNAPAHVMLWFHGGGQRPDNIILRRLTRAFAAKELNIEILSLPYERYNAQEDKVEFDPEAALQALATVKEPIFVGGHSNGSLMAEYLASIKHPMVKGAILLNSADGHKTVVPTLQIKGSKDSIGGPSGSHNPLVVSIRVEDADHSVRHAPAGSHGTEEKNLNNRSVNTWELNKALAVEMKKFVEGL